MAEADGFFVTWFLHRLRLPASVRHRKALFHAAALIDSYDDEGVRRILRARRGSAFAADLAALCLALRGVRRAGPCPPPPLPPEGVR